MVKIGYTISVDLDVFKTLTARLEQEGQTHNDVLRDVLQLDAIVETDEAEPPYSVVADALNRSMNSGRFYSRGLVLPDETLLRARYKGQEYRARIEDGCWLAEDGSQYESPSAAASGVTSTNVNGLRFWEAKRPGDAGWRRLDVIRESARK